MKTTTLTAAAMLAASSAGATDTIQPMLGFKSYEQTAQSERKVKQSNLTKVKNREAKRKSSPLKYSSGASVTNRVTARVGAGRVSNRVRGRVK